MLSRQEKLSFKKVQKWTLSKGLSPWLLSNNGHFPLLFFFRIIRDKRPFRIVLDRKECFVDKEN